jgi:hypothetical protein
MVEADGKPSAFFFRLVFAGQSRPHFGVDWYYALDGRQNGPVSEAQLEELLRAGTITPDTLVWRRGMGNWQSLKLARPEIGAGAGEGGPFATCVQCQRSFAQSEMVTLNRSWVCAACKPVFLQRMKEGATAPFTTTGIWRSRDRLVSSTTGAEFPDRCVRCNEPANGYRLKRTLSWHPPLVYLTVLINVLIYVVVALCIRKKAVLMIGLCERHRKQRATLMGIGWLLGLGGLAMLGMGIMRPGLVLAFGILSVLAGLVVALLRATRVVYPTKIDKERAWVKGAGGEFLANLPEWDGP